MKWSRGFLFSWRVDDHDDLIGGRVGAEVEVGFVGGDGARGGEVEHCFAGGDGAGGGCRALEGTPLAAAVLRSVVRGPG